MKNNKGITLIALVITIIVLLILAGITIAMLTGDNGLLTKANDAKAKDIESSVDERVRMGVAAIRLEIAKEVATDPSWDARTETHSEALRAALLEDLNQTSGLGKTATTHWSVSVDQEDGTPAVENTPATDPTASLQIIYKGQDYRNAKNGDDWRIKYSVRLDQQGLVLSSQESAQNETAVTVP